MIEEISISHLDEYQTEVVFSYNGTECKAVVSDYGWRGMEIFSLTVDYRVSQERFVEILEAFIGASDEIIWERDQKIKADEDINSDKE